MIELTKACGLPFDTAKDALEADYHVAVSVYDLIFVDFHMPDIDGLEIIETLR